jgi:hypothetical protein
MIACQIAEATKKHPCASQTPSVHIGKMSLSTPEWKSEPRAMVVLAVPVVLSELGWMGLGVVDTIMAGRLDASKDPFQIPNNSKRFPIFQNS